jgi:beta-phosphoglucomutase
MAGGVGNYERVKRNVMARASYTTSHRVACDPREPLLGGAFGGRGSPIWLPVEDGPKILFVLSGVVFDFDGVLVDSEPLHFEALKEALVGEGIAITREEYLAHYIAYDDRESIRRALEQHGRPFEPDQVGRVATRKVGHYEGGLGGVVLFKGARELIAALAARVPIAIASGARGAEIEAVLRAAGLRGAFRGIVSAESVRSGKPHPEPYRRALGMLSDPGAPPLPPGRCVAFEDSIAGIASAREAGMKVVAVTNSLPASRLALAHRVVSGLDTLSLADLDALADS